MAVSAIRVSGPHGCYATLQSGHLQPGQRNGPGHRRRRPHLQLRVVWRRNRVARIATVWVMSNGETAGWKPDPTDPTQFRFWNGVGWTEEIFIPQGVVAPQSPLVDQRTEPHLPPLDLPSPPTLALHAPPPTQGRRMGITAMWLGIAVYPVNFILGFVPGPTVFYFLLLQLLALAALVVGMLALRQLSKGESGRGPAIAGVVLSIPVLVLLAFALFLMVS